VDVLDATWLYGSLGLILVAAVGAISSAIRSDAGRLPSPGAYWPWFLLLLMMTGDAALGEGRPPFERAAKGVLAALLWTSLAIVVWRRRRHRVKVAQATPAAPE
jgi:hypothetical protein